MLRRNYEPCRLQQSELARNAATLDGLKTWASMLKRDILAFYLAGRDPWIPWYS